MIASPPATSWKTALRLQGLSKSYGKRPALVDVSLDIPRGSIFGLLGPNGSGKTTLLATVLGLLRPSAGRFSWFDGQLAPAEQARSIGALLETPNFYPYLTGSRNLRVTAAIRGRGHEEIDAVLRQVGLADATKTPFAQYSLGMKQRLALGATLLGQPEVLVLDEPTNGLDPAGLADIRALIREAHGQGRTILLASHLLDEVAKVCTHVAVLRQGRLLAAGSLEDVMRDEPVLEAACADMQALEATLASLGPGVEFKRVDDHLEIRSAHLTAEAFNRHCFERGIVLSRLHTQRRDLESRFLQLVDA